MNVTLDGLIQRCKDLVEEEDQEFVEEFVGKKDPSILHFLLASGDQVTPSCNSEPLLLLIALTCPQCLAFLEVSVHMLERHSNAPYRQQLPHMLDCQHCCPCYVCTDTIRDTESL